jgi:hypothetical protein
MDQADGGQHASIVVGTRPAWQTGMDTTRHRRLWQRIQSLRSRIRQERALLEHPGLELAAARQLARSQRRLEVLRSQLR